MENEGGMVLGLLSIAVSSVFAVTVGLLILHFIPIKLLKHEQKLMKLNMKAQECVSRKKSSKNY